MKITFLIGNGFDIGLGMRSQFSDFFPYYIQNSKDKKSTLKELSEEIDSHRQEWSYFEKQLGQYTLHFKIDSENHQEVIRKFVEQFQDFEKEFIEYLEKEEDKLTFDNEEFISTVMMNALLNFYSVTNLPIKSSRSIEDTFKALNPNRITFSFLTYNYTNALENCLQTISEKSIQFNIGKDIPCEIGKLVHVHGQKNAFPIMGVNDISQIANKELAGDQRFTRYLVKPEVNEAQRMNYDIEAKEQIKSSDIICVYGMSLGETDRLWWNLLVEWMNMSGYHQLVFFKYMPEYSESNQFDRINAEFELLDHLSEYCSNSSINVEGMRNRIHIAINKNIFEMQLNRQNINERGPFNRHDKTGRITELQNV